MAMWMKNCNINCSACNIRHLTTKIIVLQDLELDCNQRELAYSITYDGTRTV